MVTDRLPPEAANPADIEALIYKPDPITPLTLADYAAILRCYLIELNSAFGDFLTICDEGFVREAAMRLLPKDAVLISYIHGTCVPIEFILKPPFVHFFIAQIDVRTIAIVALRRIDQERAILDACGETAFFQDMEDCDIPPHQALRAIHNALCSRVMSNSNGEIVRLAPRLKALGGKVEEFLIKRKITWD